MPKRSIRLRKRRAGDAEELRGADLVALGGLHRVEREFAFEPREELHVGIGLRGLEQHLDGLLGRQSRRRPRRRSACRLSGAAVPSGMILRQQHVGGGEDAGALDGVLQFAHVARPGVAFEHAHGFLAESWSCGRCFCVATFCRKYSASSRMSSRRSRSGGSWMRTTLSR